MIGLLGFLLHGTIKFKESEFAGIELFGLLYKDDVDFHTPMIIGNIG